MELVMPSYVQTVDVALLKDTVDKLEEEILKLSQKLQKSRQYSFGTRSENGQRCSLVCQKLENTETHKECLEACAVPVVSYEGLHELEKEFPIDLKRLHNDRELRETFERYQRNPETIEATPTEASHIADIFSMPVSVFALPDEAWGRAMGVLILPQFSDQKEQFARNLHDRASVLTPEARIELARKLQNHDRDESILMMVHRTHSQTHTQTPHHTPTQPPKLSQHARSHNSSK